MSEDQILDQLYKLEAALMQMCDANGCADCPTGGGIDCHLIIIRNIIFDRGGSL